MDSMDIDARRMRRRVLEASVAAKAATAAKSAATGPPPEGAVEKNQDVTGLKIEFKVLAKNDAKASKMEAAMKDTAVFTAALHDELHSVGLDVPAKALAVVALHIGSPKDPSNEKGLGDDGKGGLGGTYGDVTDEKGGSSALAILFALAFMGGGGFVAMRHMKKRMAKSKKVGLGGREREREGGVRRGGEGGGGLC
jgi:hypothetical protein